MPPSFTSMFHFTFEFFSVPRQHDVYFHSLIISLLLEMIIYVQTCVRTLIKHLTHIKIFNLIVIFFNRMGIYHYKKNML